MRDDRHRNEVHCCGLGSQRNGPLQREASQRYNKQQQHGYQQEQQHLWKREREREGHCQHTFQSALELQYQYQFQKSRTREVRMSWHNLRSPSTSETEARVTEAKFKRPIRDQVSRAGRKFADFGDRVKKRFSPEFGSLAATNSGGAEKEAEESENVEGSDTGGSVYEDDPLKKSSVMKELPRTGTRNEQEYVDGPRRRKATQVEEDVLKYYEHTNEQGPIGVLAYGGKYPTEPWPGYMASREEQWPGARLSPGPPSASSVYSQPPDLPERNPERLRLAPSKDGVFLENPSQHGAATSKGGGHHSPTSPEIWYHGEKTTNSELIDGHNGGWKPGGGMYGDDTSTLKPQRSWDTIIRGPWKQQENIDLEPDYHPVMSSRVVSPGIGMPGHPPSCYLSPEEAVCLDPSRPTSPLIPGPPPIACATQSKGKAPTQQVVGFLARAKTRPKRPPPPLWGKTMEILLRRAPQTANDRKSPLTLSVPPSIPYNTRGVLSGEGRSNAAMAARAGIGLMERDANGYWRPVPTASVVIKEINLRPRNYHQYEPYDGGWI